MSATSELRAFGHIVFVLVFVFICLCHIIRLGSNAAPGGSLAGWGKAAVLASVWTNLNRARVGFGDQIAKLPRACPASWNNECRTATDVLRMFMGVHP